MSPKITNLQLTLMVANLTFSASMISLPQVVVQLGKQNVWVVPIIDFILLCLILFFLFRKKDASLENIFLIGTSSNLIEKIFIGVFLITVFFTLLRDLRGLVDFIAATLLPSTPIDIIVIIAVLAVIYLSTLGLEVVVRVNAVHFIFFAMIMLALPLLLMNEMDFKNLQPLPNTRSLIDIGRSVFISFSWMGEMLISLLIISQVNHPEKAKKAIIAGTGLGIFLFFVLLVCSIAVLGRKIVSEAVYPGFTLIQQINLTDFLDRLDLVIVIVWAPTMLNKLSFLFYCIHHCISYLRKREVNHLLLPISLIIGFISIMVFNNNMDHLSFSLYSWPSFGLLLQILLILLFILVKKTRNNREKQG